MASPKNFITFLSFVIKTYYKDQCLRSSAALCFTTLLSLVPLTAVVFSVLAAFPVFETIASDIQNFIFNNFIPASGEVVQQHIEEFSAKASKLTAIGIAFLILSALLMMNTIDAAINDIWYVDTPRKAIPKFMVYWAVLTLGPILMGASLAITSYLTSLPLFGEAAFMANAKSSLLSLLPFLATTLACTLLYAIVPNTHVPLRNAVIGAIVAASLFELAKKGFALYITAFPTYQVIYGALAAIPVFLAWVYISWMVILLGAEIAYCLSHPLNSQKDSDATSGLSMLHDFRIIGHIWLAQRHGATISDEKLQHYDTLLDESNLNNSLLRLEENGLIHQTQNNEWALTKDMSTLSLADLYRIHSPGLPEIKPEWVNGDPWYQALYNSVIDVNKTSNAALAAPLSILYQSSDKYSVTVHDSEKQRIEPTFKI